MTHDRSDHSSRMQIYPRRLTTDDLNMFGESKGNEKLGRARIFFKLCDSYGPVKALEYLGVVVYTDLQTCPGVWT